VTARRYKYAALKQATSSVILSRVYIFTAVRNMWLAYDVSDQAYFHLSEQVNKENTSIWHWNTESGQALWRHLRY
jgi:hypothetical protein